jgi:hypothetical protein
MGHNSGNLRAVGVILTLISPSLRDEPTGDASGQGTCYADTGYYERHPKECGAHASMMEVRTVDSVEAGHIGGTSHHVLPTTNENCRDLNRRSSHV